MAFAFIFLIGFLLAFGFLWSAGGDVNND